MLLEFQQFGICIKINPIAQGRFIAYLSNLVFFIVVAAVGAVALYNPIALVLPRSLPEVAHH